MSVHNGNELHRIEILLEKQKRLEAQIAAEKERQAKRRRRDAERLYRIIGEMMVRCAAELPEMAGKLREALDRMITDEKLRSFLKAEGWLA